MFQIAAVDGCTAQNKQQCKPGILLVVTCGGPEADSHGIAIDSVTAQIQATHGKAARDGNDW